MRLTLLPYWEQLVRPISTAHGVYRHREGIILALDDGSGAMGLGDAAPLPGFSRETLDDVRSAAGDLTETIQSQGATNGIQTIDDLTACEAKLNDWTRAIPSLRFGLESALADLAAQNQKLPLSRWLNPAAGSQVTINGLLSGTSENELIEQAHDLARAGYQTVKLKAGVTDDVEIDVRRIKAVHGVEPKLQLRVDVNGGWTKSQLREALIRLADCPLEFIEQPLPIGHAEESQYVCREFGVRLALDEDVETFEHAMRLIQDGTGDVLILKPMMIGGLVPCMRIAQAAARSGVPLVYTSAWESDVGVAATLHLALATGRAGMCAGLSTAGMIGRNLIAPHLFITEGHLSVGNRTGLGLSLGVELSDEDSV